VEVNYRGDSTLFHKKLEPKLINIFTGRSSHSKKKSTKLINA